VVFVSETVVYENAMMVELLDTSVTKVAMLSIFWAQVFTVHANVVEMVAFSLNLLKNLLEIRLFLNIPWIHKSQ